MQAISNVIRPINIIAEKTASLRNTAGALASLLRFVLDAPNVLKKISETYTWAETIVGKAGEIVQKIIEIVQKIIPVSLLAFKNSLQSAKDFLTVFEIFSNIEEAARLKVNEYWAKKVNVACKLFYSSLDFVLISSKFQWIDLGGFCNTIGSISPYLSIISPLSIGIVKDVFVIGAASFALANAANTTNNAHLEIKKSAKRITNLSPFYPKVPAFLNGSSEAVKDYKREVAAKYIKAQSGTPALHAKKVEKFKAALAGVQVLDSGIEVHRKAVDTIQKGLGFRGLSLSLGQEIAALTEERSKKIIEREVLVQKIRRFVYFNSFAFGKSVNEVLTDTLKQEGMQSRANANSLATIFSNDQEVADTDKADEIVTHKMAKATVKIHAKESEKTKANISKIYEIFKITIVVLGLTFSTGLALTSLASYAAAIGAAAWFTGLGLGIIGLTKGIYDTFYFKTPIYPQTFLTS
jgi:hypothetical protein